MNYNNNLNNNLTNNDGCCCPSNRLFQYIIYHAKVQRKLQIAIELLKKGYLSVGNNNIKNIIPIEDKELIVSFLAIDLMDQQVNYMMDQLEFRYKLFTSHNLKQLLFSPNHNCNNNNSLNLRQLNELNYLFSNKFNCCICKLLLYSIKSKSKETNMIDYTKVLYQMDCCQCFIHKRCLIKLFQLQRENRSNIAICYNCFAPININYSNFCS